VRATGSALGNIDSTLLRTLAEVSATIAVLRRVRFARVDVLRNKRRQLRGARVMEPSFKTTFPRITKAIPVFPRDAQSAARSLVDLGCSPPLGGVSRRFFEPGRQTRGKKITADRQAATLLWTVSEERCAPQVELAAGRETVLLRQREIRASIGDHPFN
jgi:hypothetical protein